MVNLEHKWEYTVNTFCKDKRERNDYLKFPELGTRDNCCDNQTNPRLIKLPLNYKEQCVFLIYIILYLFIFIIHARNVACRNVKIFVVCPALLIPLKFIIFFKYVRLFVCVTGIALSFISTTFVYEYILQCFLNGFCRAGHVTTFYLRDKRQNKNKFWIHTRTFLKKNQRQHGQWQLFGPTALSTCLCVAKVVASAQLWVFM